MNTVTVRLVRRFLPKMFGPELMQAFVEFKRLWDPLNRMNPGKLIDPSQFMTRSRTCASARATSPQSPKHGSNFLAITVPSARRRRDASASVPAASTIIGTMCPSYMATREEKHSTRGRAHLLWEMMQGDVIKDGWRNQEVKEALDLCLSCKACKTECPVNVDMATWKSEFLRASLRRTLSSSAPLYLWFYGPICQTGFGCSVAGKSAACHPWD